MAGLGVKPKIVDDIMPQHAHHYWYISIPYTIAHSYTIGGNFALKHFISHLQGEDEHVCFQDHTTDGQLDHQGRILLPMM